LKTVFIPFSLLLEIVHDKCHMIQHKHQQNLDPGKISFLSHPTVNRKNLEGVSRYMIRTMLLLNCWNQQQSIFLNYFFLLVIVTNLAGYTIGSNPADRGFGHTSRLKLIFMSTNNKRIPRRFDCWMPPVDLETSLFFQALPH
jgi:hypothetical protein